MKQYFLLHLFVLLLIGNLNSQITINEASTKNGATIYAANDDTPDWLEIYNSSGSAFNLQGYGLSNKRSQPLKWVFPYKLIDPNGFLTVYASGNDVSPNVNHYETAVFESNSWKYIIPNSATPVNWWTATFDASSWISAPLGIGYADGDDATTIANPTTSVFTQIQFNIADTSKIANVILDIDYDDGFVAFLNGIEIARFGLTDVHPDFDDFATSHEANIYQGNAIESYTLSTILQSQVLKNGLNTLSIQVHNANATSSDLSLRPFLTFGFKDALTYYANTTHPFFGSTATSTTFETNFKFKSSGQAIYLSNPIGVVIDSLIVPILFADMSFGKKPNGAVTTFSFLTPTPSASNNTSLGYSGFEMKPTLTFAGGFYPTAITATAVNNSVSGGILRYSTDGEVPNSNSPIYTGPLTISTNTVLKVRCFNTTGTLAPSQSATESYFFLDDYTIPVISISMDSTDLYGATGIFDNPLTDFKRACFMEYFDKDGVKQFSSKTSIKPDGGAGGSRTNPQHSVTLEPANSVYGDGQPVNYPLIPEKSFIDKFYSFYLRNGSNNWLQYPQKDATFMRMMKGTNALYQAYSPVVVYINGSYFGVYELREKTKAEYYENNFGNDVDSVDLLAMSYFYGPSVLRVSQGSDSSFYQMSDFVTTYPVAAPDYFDQVHTKLDLYNFTDYIAGENWFSNTDWIYNNMKLSRCRTTGNRWRFGLQDMELGLTGWSNETNNMFDWFRFAQQPNVFWPIYNGLIQNAKFKNYFINRYADLMNTNLKPSVYTPVVTDMYNELLPEMPKEFLRWTGTTNGMNDYNNNYNNMLYQFGLRSNIVRNQMITEYSLVKKVDVTLNVSPAGAGYVKISTVVPETLPWTGVYFDGNPVQITAFANPGYTFQNWIPNVLIPTVNQTDLSININVENSSTFTALFTGTPEVFSLTVSEINYNCDSSINGGNWIELHNYGTSPVALGSWKLQSKQNWDNYSIPDNTVIAPNGYLVICESIALFNSIYPSVTNYIGATNFGWSNSLDSIKLMSPNNQLNVLAVYNDSLPYPECADGLGRTLELKTNTSSLLDPNSWFCGCVKGSPGTAFINCNENMYFTEVNYNSAVSAYNPGDWVEMKNNTNAPISLQGYSFRDKKNSNVYNFPSTTIQPNEYFVLYADYGLFSAQHPTVLNAGGNLTFGLGNSDALRLYDNNGKLVTSVLYNNAAPWPLSPANTNRTLEFLDSVGYRNPNDGLSWFESCLGGSPGRAFQNCNLSLSQSNNELNFGLYPNPTSNELNLILPKDVDVEISIVDLEGRILKTKTIKSEQTLNEVKFSIESLTSGMYFVVIKQRDSVGQKAFVKI